MSIDPKFVKLTADVLEIFLLNTRKQFRIDAIIFFSSAI